MPVPNATSERRLRNTGKQAGPRLKRWAGLAVLTIALVGVVGLAGDRIWPGSPQAVIVDQLSLTAPNPGFAGRVTILLERFGYEVTYVPGEEVTVPFFKALPARGDALVILRAHSARIALPDSGNTTQKTDEVALFTGQVIDLDVYDVQGVPPPAATAVAQEKRQAHAAAAEVGESSAQGAGVPPGGQPTLETLTPEEASRLVPVFYDPESGELPFFGIRPEFIARDLEARFSDATVVLMGCDGLRSDDLAEAFVQRGAAAFVSWDEPVSAPHTDAATELLLRLWLEEGVTMHQAAARVMDEIGPDPDYGARLVVYP